MAQSTHREKENIPFVMLPTAAASQCIPLPDALISQKKVSVYNDPTWFRMLGFWKLNGALINMSVNGGTFPGHT